MRLRWVLEGPQASTTRAIVVPVKHQLLVHEDGERRIDEPEARQHLSASGVPASYQSCGCAVRVRKSRSA